MKRTLWLTKLNPRMPEVFEDLFDDVKSVHGRADNIQSQDVVLFDGGTDINPHIYGENLHPFSDLPDYGRDDFERLMFRRAQGSAAACIGICRGAQFLCAVSGGKLIQDVSGHRNNNHDLITDDGRKMTAAADHHQMMYPDGVFHKLLAWATGIGESNCEYGKQVPELEPEIIWIPDTKSLCIQPHPEWMAKNSMFQDYCRELTKKYIVGA